MFIHIGGDFVVLAKEVVAIIDVSNQEQISKKGKSYVQQMEQTHPVIRISNTDVKSIVITTNHIYFSPISSLTLKKRANAFHLENDLMHNKTRD
ncbi:extracellular matrix regulator RemB [Tepidibacillus sp. LV47]|uniref:extracellular matrix regulator RemB n=1 Tax=Tepidibacillus sp. LV47 TaxID=3398228 RepID=UPI003AAB405D